MTESETLNEHMVLKLPPCHEVRASREVPRVSLDIIISLFKHLCFKSFDVFRREGTHKRAKSLVRHIIVTIQLILNLKSFDIFRPEMGCLRAGAEKAGPACQRVIYSS